MYLSKTPHAYLIDGGELIKADTLLTMNEMYEYKSREFSNLSFPFRMVK